MCAVSVASEGASALLRVTLGMMGLANGLASPSEKKERMLLMLFGIGKWCELRGHR